MTRKLVTDSHIVKHGVEKVRHVWPDLRNNKGVRRFRPTRLERSTYMLSGMVRCARCGGTMQANAPGATDTRGGPRLRCRRRQEEGALSCQGGQIQMRIVEAHVLEWLRSKATDIDHAAAEVRVDPARVDDAERLSREVSAARAALTRLVVQNSERPMPGDVYAAAYDELDQRLTSLSTALEDAQREQRVSARRTRTVRPELVDEWGVLSAEQQREILSGLMDCVLVRAGRPAYLRVVEWDEVREKQQ